MQESKTAGNQAWLVTGANGSLGKRLIAKLLQNPLVKVTALVRSKSAAKIIEQLPLDASQQCRLKIAVLNYTDAAALHDAARECNKAVHLVGILKQGSAATYLDAHERSTLALLRALQGASVDHLTYLSIVGADPCSTNACLASKGQAEDLCRDGSLPACVLRVPMVLGEGDYASFALKSRSRRKLNFTFRAASLEQPIYAGDVIDAIIAAGNLQVRDTLELGGPEVLSRRALIAQAAQVMGKHTRVVSLPLTGGIAIAGLLARLMTDPPVTGAMLGVLDHDDDVDSRKALEALHLLSQTSLEDMLQAVLTD